jgi:hypothetical protein
MMLVAFASGRVLKSYRCVPASKGPLLLVEREVELVIEDRRLEPEYLDPERGVW